MSAAREEGGIQFGWLPFERWGELQEVFDAHGCPVPSPLVAQILVAQADGVIVAFFVRQLLFHTEPLWISDEFQSSGLWREMARRMGESFEGGGPTAYYCFSDGARTEHMLREFGMAEEVPGRKVFIKRVGG